jgi:hypothetical protein
MRPAAKDWLVVHHDLIVRLILQVFAQLAAIEVPNLKKSDRRFLSQAIDTRGSYLPPQNHPLNLLPNTAHLERNHKSLGAILLEI